MAQNASFLRQKAPRGWSFWHASPAPKGQGYVGMIRVPRFRGCGDSRAASASRFGPLARFCTKTWLHSLRYIIASALILQGRPVTEVSGLLGDSNPGVTLMAYSH